MDEDIRIDSEIREMLTLDIWAGLRPRFIKTNGEKTLPWTILDTGAWKQHCNRHHVGKVSILVQGGLEGKIEKEWEHSIFENVKQTVLDVVLALEAETNASGA